LFSGEPDCERDADDHPHHLLPLLGGFRSDVWANVLEFILMFLGFALVLPFAYHQLGGWEYIASHVPPLHLSWHGGNTWQYILVWFFIALWTLVDPAFHQRCYAAKDGATAQRGILVAIVFWFFFDFMTSMAGSMPVRRFQIFPIRRFHIQCLPNWYSRLSPKDCSTLACWRPLCRR